MFENSIIKNEFLYKIFFSFTLLLISFGSIGSGWYGNFSVAKYILYFVVLSFILLGGFDLKIDKIKILALIFFFSMVISNLFSPYDGQARQWYRLFNIVVVFSFGYSVYFYSIKKEIYLFNIFKSTMICVGISYVLFYLYAWFSMDNPRDYNWVTNLYVFNFIRNFSDFYSTIVLLAFTGLFSRGKKIFINFPLFIFILTLFIWTGTRSAFFSVLFSIFFLCYFLRINLKVFLYSISSLIISIFLSSFFYTNGNATGLINSFNRTISDNISSSRFDLWIGIIKLIEQRLLFGFGGEAVKFSNIGFLTINQNLTQAHNSILQILLEWGISGLILFALFIFCLLKKIILAYNSWSKNQIVINALILNVLLVSVFNGAFYYTATFSMLSISIALYYSEEYLKYKIHL